MSIKYFHIFFISCSVLLWFGFAAWEMGSYNSTGNTGNLLLAVLALGIGMGLIEYGRRVYRKLKNL